MYCIDEYADEPIMLLDKHIGYDDEDGQGIDGATFAQELLRLDTLGKKSIQVYINCPGGNVIEGMSIYNAILKSKTPVDTHNVGLAASMGGVVFMAGRRRYMSDYSTLMVHNPTGSDNNKALESFRNALTVMLSSRATVSSERMEKLMSKETWLSAAECFEMGLCTDVVATSDLNVKRFKKALDPTPEKGVVNPTPEKGVLNPTPEKGDIRAAWKVAKDITNNLFNKKFDMKKVTAKLKLVDGANEDQVLAGIEAIEANHSSAMEFLRNSETELRKKLEGIENKVPVLTSTVKKVTAKLGLKEDATEAEIETALNKVVTDAGALAAAKEAQLKTNAEGIVNAAVKIGKIANKKETIEGWVKLAVSDFDGTKKMIDDLPLNKTATSITDKVKVDNADEALKATSTAAGVMLQIQNRLSKK